MLASLDRSTEKPDCSVWISPALVALKQQRGAKPALAMRQQESADPGLVKGDASEGSAQHNEEKRASAARNVASRRVSPPPVHLVRLRRDGQRPLTAHGVLLFRQEVSARVPVGDPSEPCDKRAAMQAPEDYGRRTTQEKCRISLSIEAHLIDGGAVAVAQRLEAANPGVLIPQHRAEVLTNTHEFRGFFDDLWNGKHTGLQGKGAVAADPVVRKMQRTLLETARLSITPSGDDNAA